VHYSLLRVHIEVYTESTRYGVAVINKHATGSLAAYDLLRLYLVYSVVYRINAII